MMIKLGRRSLLMSGAMASALWVAGPVLAADVPLVVRADGVSPQFRALFDRLLAYAQAEIAAYRFPSMTLAFRNGKGEVATASFGFANLVQRVPVTPDHLFQIGSISKSFVAVALLRLADQGKIDLDRPVLEFAPDMPVEDRRVTTAHIINHAAGFPGNAPYFPRETVGKLWTATVPGERFHYSNSGYDALALLIERASGLKFPAAIRTLVLDPLKMSASKPVILTEDRASYAVGYARFRSDLPWFPGDRLAEGDWMDIERAAGSVASTPADMAKWMGFIAACATGKPQPLLKPASAKRFTNGVVTAPDFGPGASYAMGLATIPVDERPALHHTGGMITFSSAMTIDKASGGGAFASVNISGVGGYRPRKVTAYAVQLLRAMEAGAALPEPPAIVPTVAGDAALTAGRWVGPGLDMTIREASGGLTVTSAGVTGRLRAAGKGKLVTDHPVLSRYILEFEGEGRAERLWWGGLLLGRDAAPAQPKANAKLAGLTGRYLSNDPWVGSLDVIARGDKLLIEGLGEIEKTGEGWWRAANGEMPQERFWFDSFVNGMAQRFSFSGEPLIRQS